MPSAKCPQCGHAFLFIFLGVVVLVYENSVSDPNLIIMILGGLSTAAGLISLIVTKLLSDKN